MANNLVLCDSAQAIVDTSLDNKRKIQDYVLEGAHILLDGPIGGILQM